MEISDNPWCELLEELCRMNACNILDSALERGKEFSDYLHNDFEHFWKIKENNNTGWFNLQPLSKVTKEKMTQMQFPSSRCA